MIGEHTLTHEFQNVIERYGLEVTKKRRPNRLNVNGVGQGSVPCDETATIPIAVQYEGHVQYDTFDANVAADSWLPAILGCKSLQDKDAIIILRKGQEKLIIPGPGGYKLHCAKSAKILPLTPAPSGHMLVSCDHFAEAKEVNDPTVFILDMLNQIEEAEEAAHGDMSPAEAASSSQ